MLACVVGGGHRRRVAAASFASERLLAAAAEIVKEQKPVVIASPAHLAPSKDSIDLPGDLQAMVESPIFARADGYLKSRKVDIGDRVKTGQLMAEIETPELDQQIDQARATLAQSQAALKELEADIELSRANLNLSKVTLDRWDASLHQGRRLQAGSAIRSRPISTSRRRKPNTPKPVLLPRRRPSTPAPPTSSASKR